MFLQMALFYSLYGLVLFLYTYFNYILFICSSVDGRLDCFLVLAIINNAAMNIGVHVSFQSKVFSGYMPRGAVARSHVSCT